MRHALLSIAIAGLTALAAGFIENDFYLRILFNIGIYFLCAAGMNVLLGFAGQKSLGQAGLFAAGAYGAALLTTSSLDLGPWLALALSVVIAAGCGVLIAAPSLRVRGPSLAMVTLAFGIVAEKLVTEAEVFGGAMGIYAIKPLTFAGAPLEMVQWVWLVAALGLVLQLLLHNLLTGRYGRAFLSLQADEVASAAVGVPVHRTKVLAFVIAAATCGLAGALVAQQNQYINSDFITFHLSIFILLLVLFGGAGSFAGPILGAVTLTVVSALVARWAWIEHFVQGALLLFALYVMPKGLAGVLDGLFRRGGRTEAARRAGTPSAHAVLPRRPDRPGAEAPLLEALGLNKAYGGVRPARDVSLRLRTGHIHALIGPNGAGKSTLINMLSGVVRADSGSVTFRGQSILRAAPHAICGHGIARTFQNLRLFRELSVRDNALLGQHARMRNGFLPSLLGLPLSWREERAAAARVEEILRFLGLSELADQPAGSLPYGLQRRVELARALATEPHLLLLDEPAAGLNPQETAELGQLLLRIREQGITMLLVEHHMDLVMAISDHVIVLDYGAVIAEGTPAQVQADPRVMAAYLGTEEACGPAGAEPRLAVGA
ncbi:branched-chain amino acid ABC transporter ATP-binding protein/permease [Roseomonas marmotae]|uniref:Branched-chain amino acid ABC transporter ATP-binding protein/permease n=1 Tax=Roseomonas marmotae TaxID=2768161 RepID=A0ABS3KD95_9PROT|nr:branched-chain amino acid ABC transporter ATP-binding protein/permease [Roseomonas marmotae]MBO1074613.1 branched-chain amino acid ABC transporter ATP-binding protein/permease [Roseomonas marmotae]QTI81636.1 branched-chain amino acid ABC transporter ATP-binding protein/permease [Roseomonas marmotae]